MFNNDASDGSFGVTEPIVLDEVNPCSGRLVKAVPVPDNPARGDYLTTSFSSKSELADIQSTDTVYFADPNGSATAVNGVGLPSKTETLPSASDWTAPAYSTSTPALGLTTSNPGLTPTNAYILKGFPTALATNATDASDYPFGLWFANPTTLYVADEGAGDNTYDPTTNTYTAAATGPSRCGPPPRP